ACVLEMAWLVLAWCVFFFQAEDGIRDWSVTGVQTCALPISHHLRQAPSGAEGPARAASDDACGRPAGDRRRVVGRAHQGAEGPRSEERRVGKEWRSRWAPSH